ncbi:alkaline phosphatase family protein [Streptomyces sp. NPDC087270]|uniref:alkaline phosphatase family protein n=1 Tax=Streptomyces sp. NPDC087270 TaxID=3365774 RepID=UPI0038164549
MSTPRPIADPTTAGRRPKALLIVVDGTRYDRLTAAGTPAIDSVGQAGVLAPSHITDTALTLPVSGPGHASLHTGVWPDKHLVFDNEFAGHDLTRYPPLFTRIGRLRPDLVTFSSADWAPINDFLIASATTRLQPEEGDPVRNDAATTRDLVHALKDRELDLAYAYFHQVDATGHAVGSDSDAYGAAIERVDGHIGDILSAVRARPTHAEEDWLVLVATDHGQTGDLHGGDEETTRTAWIAASASWIDTGTARARTWRQVDVVPSILRHFAIPVDPAWGLDGVPIGTPGQDPFDTVAVPDGATSTGQLPAGWSRLERTPDSGDPGYRGWRLIRQQDWAREDGGRGRGSFVRSRDMIAVADSRRWGGTGDFDSTLRSPWTPVTPGARFTVSFLSHYRLWNAIPEFGATVHAEFDDGSTHRLWLRLRPESQLSTPLTLTGHCPDGAGQVRIAWRLVDPGTRGYWAISAPEIAVATT